MAFNSVLFLALLVVISTLTAAPSVAEAQILVRISGIVKCAVNVVATSNPPAFPNARAQLKCGAAEITSAITNPLGSFNMLLTNPAVLLDLLPTCTVAVRTPLAQCNSSLPSAGTLIAPLVSSLPTIDGANIVMNLVAGSFNLVLN